MLFLLPRFASQDGILRNLGAAFIETPVGPWVQTDASGKTSIDGVWAAGNIDNPAALVAMAAGAGVAAAVAINAGLVNDDIERAHRTARRYRES